MDTNLKTLLNNVVAKDYCIGCGICASLSDSPLKMKLNEDGKYQPFLDESVEANDMKINPLAVCPFSNDNKNETEIGNDVFGHIENISFNEYTGYVLKNYAGYVKKGEFRQKGSSGGMGNWIAAQLLKNDMVDGILHIKSADQEKGLLFEYEISYTEAQLFSGAKSKYYPIELSQVIQLMREKEGRYAVIGIPCYLKGLRLLADQDPIVKDRIKFFLGLVCGHLKSDMFAKSIGWQLGIEPNNLETIDFRKKLEGKAANDYGVEVTGEKDGEHAVLSAPTKSMYTTNWGHGLFKYNACEFCDDVLGETADITVGDAWLPEYSHDGMGTNIITVRNPAILKVIEENIGELYLEEISSEKIYQSQAGGFRHRRDGLAYRLHLTDQKKEWRPIKRVEPNSKMSRKRKKIYTKRMELSKESFNAYKAAEKEQNFEVFVDYMNPLIKKYNKIAYPKTLRKTLGKYRRDLIKLVKNR